MHSVQLLVLSAVQLGVTGVISNDFDEIYCRNYPNQNKCENSRFCVWEDKNCEARLVCYFLNQEWCTHLGDLCGGYRSSKNRCHGCVDDDNDRGRQHCVSVWDTPDTDLTLETDDWNWNFMYPYTGGCDNKFCLGRGTAKRQLEKTSNLGGQRTLPLCACDCSDKWEGHQCERCPPQYDQATCSVCITPGGTINDCPVCHTTTDCNGHATNVVPTQTGCDCVCSHQWDGPSCAVCPVLYNQASCDMCASSNAIDYPTCAECNIMTDCRAASTTSVAPDPSLTSCVCVCMPGYGGARCDKCKEGFIGDALTGCTECTVAQHCNGRAQSVTDLNRGACVCSGCADSWEGQNCDVCDPLGTSFLNQTTCSSCKDGYLDTMAVPRCRKCDIALDCSGHSSFVALVAGKCKCTCSALWTGDDCSVCPPHISMDKCSECAPGFFGASCAECQVDTHCSSHASAVTSVAPFDKCACSCKGQWSGDDCSVCLPKYEQGACESCQEGVDGYVGYPQCTQCTPIQACSDHADTVTAEMGVCKCTCRWQWKGPTCADCLPIHAGSDCNECAPGRINFPVCEECTNVAHCNGRAISVQADVTSCLCQCDAAIGMWSGSDCSVCAPKYKQDGLCNDCAAPVSYPVCGTCTSDDCNNRGTASMSGHSCLCDCDNFWGGRKCDECAAPSTGTDCDQCISGYVLMSMQCVACTCTAGGIPQSVNNVCSCKCSGKWTGAQCDQCDPIYEPTECASCAAGHIMFPICTTCSDACMNAATAATDALQSECICSCTDKWSGPTCSECDAQYEQTACATCATDRVHYPACNLCDVGLHCNDHALSAEYSTPTSCTCLCRNQWSGPACATCESPFGGADCDACVVGYAGYPLCTECDLAAHCAHATAVSSAGTEEHCQCSCEHSWSHYDCSVCDAPYGGADCNECLPGLFDYPACIPCSSEYCGVYSLDATLVNDVCQCECKPPWVGPQCDNCTTHFAGASCEHCSKGRYAFPHCHLCSDYCSPVGATANTDGTTCDCDCLPGHIGPQCTECAQNYSKYSDGRCSPNDDPNLSAPLETLAPNSQIIPQDRLVTFNRAKTGASVASAMGGPSSALGAGRLGVFLSLCHGSADQVLDPEITPLGLSVGDSEWQQEVGGVIGNAILLLGAMLLHMIVVAVVMVTRRKGSSFASLDASTVNTTEAPPSAFWKAASTARFPYVSIFFVLFLFHGMATCGLKLLVYADTVPLKILGVCVVFFFNFGFMTVVVIKVRRLAGHAVYYEKERTNILSRFLFGRGEWVSAGQKGMVKSWGILFEMYRPGWTWFLLPECFILLAITGVQVAETREVAVCRTLSSTLASLFGFYTAVVVFFRPWASHWDNMTFGAIAFLEAVAMALMGASFTSVLSDYEAEGDHIMMLHIADTATFATAGVLLQIVTYITIVKGCVDPLLLLYVEVQRRVTVQKGYDADCKAGKEGLLEAEHTDSYTGLTHSNPNLVGSLELDEIAPIPVSLPPTRQSPLLRSSLKASPPLISERSASPASSGSDDDPAHLHALTSAKRKGGGRGEEGGEEEEEEEGSQVIRSAGSPRSERARERTYTMDESQLSSDSGDEVSPRHGTSVRGRALLGASVSSLSVRRLSARQALLEGANGVVAHPVSPTVLSADSLDASGTLPMPQLSRPGSGRVGVGGVLGGGSSGERGGPRTPTIAPPQRVSLLASASTLLGDTGSSSNILAGTDRVLL